MDIDLQNRIEETISYLQTLSDENIDYQLMDPVGKMMLVAMLHETQKIQDYIEGAGQRIAEHFCEDFIPRAEVNAMPSVALVSPKVKGDTLASIGTGAQFQYKVAGSKTPLAFLPLFNSNLIPFHESYVLGSTRLQLGDKSFFVEPQQSNVIWVGIHTPAEIEHLFGLPIYLKGLKGVLPSRVSVVNSKEQDLEFATMNRLEELEWAEPFDAQQASGTFISLVQHFRTQLFDHLPGTLLYIIDKVCDRDVFKPKRYPNLFQNFLEQEYLDHFSDNTLWLRIEFPQGYVVPADFQVVLNSVPVTNIERNELTLTPVEPIKKLQKQDNSFFLSVVETSSSANKMGFKRNEDEIVIRDFDASCFHNGDLYRDVRTLYDHFVEDYYAFIESNGIKDGEDIKNLRELINKIGKGVGVRNAKYNYDSGVYVMKNISHSSMTTSTRVSYLTTQGDAGNRPQESHHMDCVKASAFLPEANIVASAQGGCDKATADRRYELLRYYTLTNDRLFTKMDIEAFVRKELVSVFGIVEFRRIFIDITIGGAPGTNRVERGLYIDISFKDLKNYSRANDMCLDRMLLQRLNDKSCLTMPIVVRLINLEQ